MWWFGTKALGKWKEILLSKYDPISGQRNIPDRLKSWWWRDIAKSCVLGGEENWFKKSIVSKIGAGDKVRFWEDKWVGDEF